MRGISFVEVNGVRIRVSVEGAGPPLMFLFGSGSAGTIENAKPLVDCFTGQFTVACPDQRGLGQSDVPPGPWSMADYAADAFGLADVLGWDRFSVIGLSFGGMVGLEMACQSDRVDRMVLWGTSPGGEAHSYPLHTLDGLPVVERERRFAELMDTRLAGQWGSEPSPEALLVKTVLDRGGSPWAVRDGVSRRGVELQLEARRGHNVLSRLGRIGCPTLIGAGFYDGLAPVVNAEAMHAGIAGSVLRVYDAGHFFYVGKRALSDGIGFLSGA